MTRFLMAAAVAFVLTSTPSIAQDSDPLAPQPQEASPRADADPTPAPTPAPVQIVRDWPSILNAISRQQWEVARQSIAAMNASDPLHDYALAELYLAAGSPRIDGAQAARLANRSWELPQTGALARIAAERGGESVRVPGERTLVTLGGAPRRYRARSVGGAQLDALQARLRPSIEADDGPTGEAIYREAVETGGLTGEARAEIANRVAWIYYVSGDIASARRLALEGISEGNAEWRAQSAWTFGLASWRQGDCTSAATGFRLAALYNFFSVLC